jgi:acetyl-CoA carboxylase carboxyl transferase subunit alpha
MVKKNFDYEQKYQQLFDKVNELRIITETTGYDLSEQLQLLEEKLETIRKEKYQNLKPWEKLLLVRCIERPTSMDYIKFILDDYMELHGDRCFGDDPAIVGGIGEFEGQPVTFLGHQKGEDTNDNIRHNFGMPNPEGYRKIQRLLLQAAKFKRPVLTFIDTPGAFPGIGAEERGQAWAISEVLATLSYIPVPIIAVVTGEGGSGGALALAVSDHLVMLSNAVFSVASPEACASILWKDVERADEMAATLKITAGQLLELGIIDEVVEEPAGGIQVDFEPTAQVLKDLISTRLKNLKSIEPSVLVQNRYNKLKGLTNKFPLTPLSR